LPGQDIGFRLIGPEVQNVVPLLGKFLPIFKTKYAKISKWALHILSKCFQKVTFLLETFFGPYSAIFGKLAAVSLPLPHTFPFPIG
jgi:hypothetical protein